MIKIMNRHYKEISFGENRARLKLLKEFRLLVTKYFANSTLNMISGNYNEKQEAVDAREAINLILQKVYEIIRLADIKTYSASNTTIASFGQGKSMDLILNIFNLGRNEISPDVAIDYIERAIDVYKSNRIASFIRTMNPVFWFKCLVNCIVGKSGKSD